MVRYGPQNHTSIGETAILVFLNVILFREGYKFVDMTIQCNIGNEKMMVKIIVTMLVFTFESFDIFS